MNLEELAARNKRRETRSPAIITGVRASLPRELSKYLTGKYNDTQRRDGEYKTPPLTPNNNELKS